jgi:serine/threonine-protein kinase
MNLVEAIEHRLPRGFTIERQLGAGATSWVYLASRDAGAERLVVKVMRLGTVTDAAVARFLSEMQALRKLNHPRIIPMLEPGEANGALFFTMPWIPGETLHTRLRGRGPFGVEETVRIARDIAAALEHAHGKGIVHRDVKPANVLLAQEGGAYLMDFGFANTTTLAAEGAVPDGRRIVVGTPDYMSPEQITGKRADDWRGDLYSLGCVMHEMLLGRPPFTGGSRQAVMKRRLSAPAPDVRAVRPEVPADVAAIIQRNLAVAPSDRFETAGALVLALDSALRKIGTAA